MWIPVDEPTSVYGDKQSVLANTTIPGSTLKKKTQSIAFHHVREGTSRDEWQTAYVNTHDKKQTSCETNSFGSEFCDMKQATEYVRGLR